MTDTTHGPELTPRDREMMRRGYIQRMRECGLPDNAAKETACLAIPEPPAYTYSAEVVDCTNGWTYRRRSDGVWEFCALGVWKLSRETDAHVRQRAACVPLTDAECEALTIGISLTAASRYAFIRAAFARVMRGEVAP